MRSHGRRHRFVWLAACGLLVWTTLIPVQPAGGAPVLEPAPAQQHIPPVRQTWAHPSSLRDHFQRHGRDFDAKTPEEYAGKAWLFLQRARADGLPAKKDDQGVIRIWDAKTSTFAAYTPKGKTKTFFKPRSHDYFQRQPGRPVDLKTLRF